MFVKRYDWSHKHERCVVCKTTNAKHHGNGVCNTCYTRMLKDKNPQYRIDSNERTRIWNRKIRKMVLERYSQGEPECACCGETTEQFLAIDHVDNNGTEHRKITKGSGSKTYVWLYKNDFPPGFQVLCHNCNMAKSLYGKCPHNAN